MFARTNVQSLADPKIANSEEHFFVTGSFLRTLRNFFSEGTDLKGPGRFDGSAGNPGYAGK